MKFSNREIGDEGDVLVNSFGLIEMLYNDIDINSSNFLIQENDPEIKLYNSISNNSLNNVNYQKIDIEKRRNDWFYPSKYDDINLEQYLLNLKIFTNTEENRIKEELNLFIQKGFEKFLRFCIYLSDIIKEKDLVVGVGRGSSCASFILYILSINLINPLVFGLDIKEFLK